ncbi:Alpha/Beta hydrolase protein [Talaromyces proteolyticus]|uniref:Alpha/Beta hydrolase protein n=1 Tax=Talaromyces proteolyticus TaxID=1131652 RepID=A0AAD4KQ77_9EURO|nr:Alpha/Beta hydrolase protein [Talaromyces proteolyticus]KAH8694173.1 Alpha/Beta hydrolase protein [Talaromyces proteolyticus]
MTAFQNSGTIIINPSRSPHKQTIILLHDRGGDATGFGPAILFKPLRVRRLRSNIYHSSQETTTLKAKFPHAKFIFPTAASQYSKASGHDLNQWFDNWPLHATTNDPDDQMQNEWRNSLPISGLRQTVRTLHELLEAEIGELGGNASGIVLGGFGQGSAASFISALLWEGKSLGALTGMCGWLPFVEDITRAALNEDADMTPADNGDNRETDQNTAIQRGVNKLRDILELPSSSTASLSSNASIQNTQLFIAHAAQDGTVPIALGRRAGNCLEALGLDVERKEYMNGGHECSEEILCDLVDFLWNTLDS